MSLADKTISKEQVLAAILKSIGANTPVGVYNADFRLAEVIGAMSVINKVAMLAGMEYLGEFAPELHSWEKEGFPQWRMTFRFQEQGCTGGDGLYELVICTDYVK